MVACNLCKALQLAAVPFTKSFTVFSVENKAVPAEEAVAAWANLCTGTAAKAFFCLELPFFMIKIAVKAFFQPLCVKFPVAAERGHWLCELCLVKKAPVFFHKLLSILARNLNKKALLLFNQKKVVVDRFACSNALAEAVFTGRVALKRNKQGVFPCRLVERVSRILLQKDLVHCFDGVAVARPYSKHQLQGSLQKMLNLKGSRFFPKEKLFSRGLLQYFFRGIVCLGFEKKLLAIILHKAACIVLVKAGHKNIYFIGECGEKGMQVFFLQQKVLLL
jgi:hypothetical protein